MPFPNKSIRSNPALPEREGKTNVLPHDLSSTKNNNTLQRASLLPFPTSLLLQTINKYAKEDHHENICLLDSLTENQPGLALSKKLATFKL